MNIILAMLVAAQMEAPAVADTSPRSRILVVYYSRTGTTQRVGNELALALNADEEMIRDKQGRGGLLGYIRSGYEATSKRLPAILPTEKDPADYDLVVLGTPVWAGTMSSPMRTYITENRDKFRQVAFFCTQGGTSEMNVFRDMSVLCGKTPVAVLSLQHDVVFKNAYADRLKEFADELRAASEPSPVPPMPDSGKGLQEH